MKNKNIFVFGIISLVIFIGIASYLWYLYFHEYEARLITQNNDFAFMRGVEFVNSGPIDYLNAKTDDVDSIIPTYYFRIKNNSEQNFYYELHLEEALASDGCTKETTFKRDELLYELKLDNKLIKSGGLETLSNDILDSNLIKENSINDYSLKIKLKEGLVDYETKHYHYIVTLKEKK